MIARALGVVATLAALALPSAARADDLAVVGHLEGGAGFMLTDRYRDRFDAGGGGYARLGVELAGPLLELRVSGGAAWFPVRAGDPGTLFTLGLGARTTILLDASSLPALGGPLIDGDVSLAVTGDLIRAALDVGVGWSFYPLPELGLGPIARYVAVIQDPGDNVPDPASLVFVGLDDTLRRARGGGAPPVPAPPPPPRDDDGDGVLDDADRCPAEPEDVDGFQDDDGCPDLDDDSDGFPDVEDVCPRLPESRNGFDDEDGCPDEAPPPEPAPVTRGEPRLLAHRVYFRVGEARVSPRYRAEIQAVCDALAAAPSARLRVIGHADEQGTAGGNQRLGAERAGAVAEQLVICGLAPVRIESASYGDSRPACESADTAECHEQNRRVDFELLEP